jgi:hypothetical protein
VLLCSVAMKGADLPAWPQVRILVYGVDQLAHCAQPVKELQAELQTLAYPDGWIIGLVCTPVAWDSLLRIADPPPTRTAFTNFIRHSTVVNAAIFRLPRSVYRHTLAHELAHVLCQCKDENQAEHMARSLERMPAHAPVRQTASATTSAAIHGTAP